MSAGETVVKRFIFILFIILASTVQVFGATGWYVIIPPTDKQLKALDTAPLSQWRIKDAADSAEVCAIKREAIKDQLIAQSDVYDKMMLADMQKMDKDGNKIEGNQESLFDYWMYKLGLKDNPDRDAFDLDEKMRKWNGKLDLLFFTDAQDATCISASDPRLRK